MQLLLDNTKQFSFRLEHLFYVKANAVNFFLQMRKRLLCKSTTVLFNEVGDTLQRCN